MGKLTAEGSVDFDFFGSLELARKLWQLADQLVFENVGREMDGQTASAKWRGSYANEFLARRENEQTSSSTIINALRNDAREWAKAWATAMHQQNKNNRAAEVARLHRARGLVEKLVDASPYGRDESADKLPPAKTVPVPTPPQFLPTATEQVF